jgi:alkaline phosphatase D
MSHLPTATPVSRSLMLSEPVNESHKPLDPLDYDAWDGYQGNRNRTFQHLYENNITNNIVMSGDSHLSWVSDLVWLDEESYDPTTGAGSVGVEFAGSAVSSPCPYGQNISMANADVFSDWLVHANAELQWQDVCRFPLTPLI